MPEEQVGPSRKRPRQSQRIIEKQKRIIEEQESEGDESEEEMEEQERREQRVAEAGSDADDFLLVFDDVTVRILLFFRSTLFFNFIVYCFILLYIYHYFEICADVESYK